MGRTEKPWVLLREGEGRDQRVRGKESNGHCIGIGEIPWMLYNCPL